MTTWKPINRPAAPYRMPEGDIDTFRKMYEADEYKGITNARDLLEEAYQEVKRTSKRAKGYPLPKTFKEVLDQEKGQREGDKTPATFPNWLYFDVIGKANLILDDTETAKATLAYLDGEELKEGMNPPNVLSSVQYKLKDVEKANIPTQVYVKTMNLDFFTHPEKLLSEWIEDSDTDTNRQEIEAFREAVTKKTFDKIVSDIAKETGDDERQLKDPAKRTDEQKALLLTALRKAIAAKNEKVWKSVLMQTFYYCRDVEKQTKLRADTVKTVLTFAVAYYYTMHPEKDYTAEADPKEARDGAEAAEIYNEMLSFVEKREQGTSVFSAIYDFIDNNTKPEADKEEIKERVETTANTLKVYSKKYSNLLNANATNDFISTGNKQLRKDIQAGTATAKTNKTEFTFTHPDNIDLSTPCKKVFEVATMKLTKNLPLKEDDANIINKARKVDMTVGEYMDICGIKNKTQAYQQLNNAARTIYNVSMKFPYTVYEKKKITGKDGKKKTITVPVEKVMETRILEALERDLEQPPQIENGKITFHFAFGLTQHLSFSPIMPFNNALLKIDPKHNPYSFYLGRKLLIYKNSNKEEGSGNRISVEKLIAFCPYLPSYEEIMSGARQVRKRIIEPIERDLNRLQDDGILLDWHYCKAKGEPIPDDEISNATYTEWKKFLIEFELAPITEELEGTEK